MSLPAVFRHRAFAIMWSGRIFNQIATLTQSVTIGWVVYTTARLHYDERQSMFLVGMIGLAQFLPMFPLALIAGETADRYDRRLILLCCYLLHIACAVSFTLLLLLPSPPLIGLFIIIGFFGVARAFAMPAGSALLPALVPKEVLPKAIAWSTLSIQSGMVLGPWLGGVLCAISPALAMGVCSACFIISSLAPGLLLRMQLDAKPKHNGSSRAKMIREGLLHLWDSKIVLGAISLDLFAVLLGGVTALLPAYAKDILDIGPEGFGHLRSAFALGGGLMTLALALNPIRRHVGKWMMGAVIIFGISTLCFAYSLNFWLSLGLLAIAGAADSISVSVRQNLVQIVTPDAMRGRVSAVSGLFISASNEFGEFESGVAARLLGIVGSAAFGGAGSVVITCLWAKLFPALRKADRLVGPPQA